MISLDIQLQSVFIVVSHTYTHSLALVPLESWTTRWINSAMLVHLSINKARIVVLKWKFKTIASVNRYSPFTHVFAGILKHTMQHHYNIDYFHFFCHIFWFRAIKQFVWFIYLYKHTTNSPSNYKIKWQRYGESKVN